MQTEQVSDAATKGRRIQRHMLFFMFALKVEEHATLCKPSDELCYLSVSVTDRIYDVWYFGLALHWYSNTPTPLPSPTSAVVGYTIPCSLISEQEHCRSNITFQLMNLLLADKNRTRFTFSSFSLYSNGEDPLPYPQPPTACLF